MTGDSAATCADKHYFPRDPIARVSARHAVCEKRTDHDGAHEMRSGSMLYTWRDEKVEPE